MKRSAIALSIIVASVCFALAAQAPAQNDANAAVEAYNRGSDLLSAGKYTEAIQHFDKAISLNKQYVEAYNNRGIAYFSLRQPNQAISDYTQAITINPQMAECFYNRGVTFNEIGQHAQSIKDFDEAIRLNPQYAESYNNRGFAYYKLKQNEKAIEDFSHAIQIAPRYAKAYYNRGIAYNEMDQTDLAIKDFDRSLSLDSNYAESYNNRGVAYIQRGEFDRALNDFSQAITANPQLSIAAYNRGYVSLILRRGDAAAANADAFLQMEGWRAERSQYAAILSHFGYRQSHRDREARRALDEAASRCDTTAWPYPIIRYLRQEIGAYALLTSATEDGQVAEARTYLGLDLFLSGKAADAEAQLGWIKEKGRWKSFEYNLASALSRAISVKQSALDRR